MSLNPTYNNFLLTMFILFGVMVIAIALISGSDSGVVSTAHAKVPSALEERATKTIATATIAVVDGDTIKVGKTNYRLMGFDTPETFQAKCLEEREAGQASTYKLAEILSSVSSVQLEIHGRDKYNRVLARVYIRGMDVANIMITSGHAVAYNGKTKRKEWCDVGNSAKSTPDK